MFSVVVPTLQMSPYLEPLVALYHDHPLVGEIVVVNNAPEPLDLVGAKIRVLNQPTNLFVNPSWNLGASLARFDKLVISNDDILFPPPLLDAVDARLNRRVGMIGPHSACLREGRSRRPLFLPAYERTPGYGVLFFLAREDWVPIPDDLVIWCGDDWQFAQQAKRNYWFVGPRIVTHMGTTSRRPEFSERKSLDLTTYHERYASRSPYLSRFGAEARIVNDARAAVRRLRGQR